MNSPAADAEQAILALRDLRISLPQAAGRCELVKGVSLDLHPGRVTGLVGESGSGKTLTAHALLGLLPGQPDGQAVRVAMKQLALRHGNSSLDLSTMTEADWRRLRGRSLAMIFQEPQSALDPVFSIGRQMVRVIRRQRRVDPARAREIAVANLQDCGLPDTGRILESYPHQLSGGMRQRVMIALALACEPAVLVADEPTAALDIASRDQVLALLRRAASQRGVALLLITHDLAAVARICDDLLVMYAGRMVEAGPASRLLSQPQHPYTAALLQATARVGLEAPAAVLPIPGRAAPLTHAAPGCAFAERCNRVIATCREQLPPVVSHTSGPGHHCCFNPLGERLDG